MAHPIYSQWRVVEHECGWSSRWLITRVHLASRRVQVLDSGYTSREDADAALEELRAKEAAIPTEAELLAALGPCGK